MRRSSLVLLVLTWLAAPSRAVELEALGNILVNGSGIFKSSIAVSAMAAPALAPAASGVFYFDSTANKFRVSENAGVYWNLVPGGTTNYLPKFAAAPNILANSSITDDATTVGIGSNLQVTVASGDLSKIKNVAYAWPSSQGGASTVLQNNGSGALSWATVTGSGDNLGNHTATANLDMSSFSIVNVASITMVRAGLTIATSTFIGASGVFISTAGSIYTLGLGNGTALHNARGIGAVDFQNTRTAVTQVASGPYAVVSGGSGNVASNANATVSGGNENSAAGSDSTVGGGKNNSATTTYATVGGGQNNTASGSQATVAGGNSNTASGVQSAVPGGASNVASGNNSFAAGSGSNSTAAGAFTWSDSAGIVTTNNVADRVWVKSRGGFLVTGSTQPISDGAFYVNGQGAAQITKMLVQAVTDADITLTSADFGKTITMNSASAHIVTLPSVTDSDIGAIVTVVKLGVGTVTITAPSGVYIADSVSGGSLFNNLPQDYATVSLRLVTTTKWVIIWGHGCWTTN